ncbi:MULTISPECIES: pseudouridine synthase [Metabacillus]|uniref:Pseudouridine synthase n=2 Tax=Metabacillus TaxID=2675233 RepID=A0A179TAD5_9BACI|nr:MULTISPECIES: pseudouridine synthase [Metabacillus]OAS89393.1 23S rRNA pseudouridine synthase F [Metabacillus litoralis]QNF28909.1 pseudouridine synthase [Metabacillus sp. KUDC1714]
MRINKYISETGFCSRRETDRLIESQRIMINGVICVAGATVEEGDLVLIDGKPLGSNGELVYLVLNKPAGITCTAAKHIEGNIIDFINYPERIFPIGRLDKASEGLILLTNDGDIVNKIMRSENNHEKEYVVTVDKPFSNSFIDGMANGVEILGVKTKPCKVTRISDNIFRITLTQGLNRQIRRMSKVFGYKVIKLERIRIMNIALDNLPRGKWRELTQEELFQLKGKLQ